MQKLTIRLLTAVLTFFIGLIATTIWWGQRTTTVERIAMRTKIACQWPQTNNADDIYVPADAFLPDESRENRLVKPYSALLTAMDEPSLLSTMSDEYEAYRIVWLRPFHPKVVVRVWKAGSESCLSVKKFDGQGEYVHGETVYLQRFQNETRPLREVEWEGFTEHLNLGHFWSMPTVDEGQCQMMEPS